MIERGGAFTWPDDNLWQGILQAASESVVRYRLLRNCNLRNIGAISKDRGIRAPLIGTAMASGDTLRGFDAHFNDGTQKFVVVNATSASTSDAFIWNPSTEDYDAQSLGLAVDRPDMIMFGDKLILMNGTDFKSLTSTGTWTTVSGSPPAAKFATLHAERLIVGGVSGAEWLFYPSGVRDETDWDSNLAVTVTAPRGEKMTSLGRLGEQMIVQTRASTHAYYLGTANPRDWDRFDVSNTIGNVVETSWVEVERARGDNLAAYGFFWSSEGPYMVAKVGRGAPVLYSLWDPLNRSVREIAFQDMPAIDSSAFANIRGVYVPEYNEVRFAVTKSSALENDAQLCVNVDSAIAYASGGAEFPYWRLRDNEDLGYFPGEALFTARVGTDGRPSATGLERAFAGRDGIIYELDAPATYKDMGTEIPFFLSRSGYDGKDDGVRDHTKSMRHVHVRATQVGDGVLYVRVIADGGGAVGEAEIDLDKGLIKWDDSTWNGAVWNDGEFVTERGDAAVLGKRFKIELFDNGNISEEFQLDGLSLSGFVEDRR